MTLFLGAYPYQKTVMSLPVLDIDKASAYYSKGFGMTEKERSSDTVILTRDGVDIGFQINGGDASQDGAAIEVTDAQKARAESA